MDARIAVDGERGRVGRSVEHRNRKGSRIPSCLNRCLAQAGHRSIGVPAGARVREPAGAELYYSLDSIVRHAAEVDRWVRLLIRFRIEPNRIEIDEVAVKLGGLLGPQ